MIYISSGFNKSHLILAASEFSNRGLLKKLFIGMYPTHLILGLTNLPLLNKLNKLKKLKGRAEKNIVDSQVKQLILQEYAHQFSYTRFKLNKNNPYSKILIRILDKIDNLSHKYYGEIISSWLEQEENTINDVYLYRAGFGHQSVATAKQLGMYTVCDHTIAHPQLVDYMTENKGNYPIDGQQYSVTEFWNMVEQDMNQADHILVNSDFVKETCIHQGLKPENITVIYLGLDDQFLNHLPKTRNYSTPNETLKFLFAGSFETRKGAIEIIEAFLKIDSDDWTLGIVGSISSEILSTYPSFFKLKNVNMHGFVLRDQLAKLMSQNDVFVFPSLVEGSARVIFEAMASGCYIITTENSGSIVKNNEHGTIIPPGNTLALATIIQDLLTERSSITAIGKNNTRLVKAKYLQSQYGDQLLEFYNNIK
ncbi:MAG: glycosyltransferase family 4 protein [Methylobacter sp.]|nr:glycosyltransferase family 4 protein [Methylobacter sp.]